MLFAEHIDSSFFQVTDQNTQRPNETIQQRSEPDLVDTGADKPSKVQFFVFAEVILIPSRSEYRQANCDLWWSREDFQNFQESAVQEIRGICQSEGLSVREARSVLYQPSPADLHPPPPPTTPTSPEAPDDADEDELHASWSTFSLTSLADETEEVEEGTETESDWDGFSEEEPVRLFSWHAFQSAQHLPSLTPLSSLSSSPSLSSLSLSQSSLDLCVLLPQKQTRLRWKESSLSPSISRPKRRVKAGAERDGGAMMTLMGICSFALPVLGYFIVQAQLFPDVQ